MLADGNVTTRIFTNDNCLRFVSHYVECVNTARTDVNAFATKRARCSFLLPTMSATFA